MIFLLLGLRCEYIKVKTAGGTIEDKNKKFRFYELLDEVFGEDAITLSQEVTNSPNIVELKVSSSK